MLDLATVAAFVFAVSLVWLLARWLLGRQQATANQFALEGGDFDLIGGASDVPSPWVESLAAQLPDSLVPSEELDKDLRRAGRYGMYARQRLLALRNGLTIFVILATGGILVALGPGQQRAMLWTAILGAVGTVLAFTLPRVFLAIQAKRRVGRIRDALPDALDTVSMCLHGGISFQECLKYVGKELAPVHPDLAVELMMVGQHTDINSFDFALQQFASRIDAPEVISLASMVSQNQRLGTGIVDSIRDFADNLRLKRRQMAEGKASRAELFLLFPVIFCLMPSVLLILWGPPVLSLISFLTGPNSPLRIAR